MRARVLVTGLATALAAAGLCACAVPPQVLARLPLVDREDQAAYETRVAAWRARAQTGFAAYDHDRNGIVSFDEWVEANHRLAMLADIDGDGALDRYEALLYRDVPQRRALYGQAALSEFGAFWKAYARNGRLRKAQLTAYFRADFVVDDVDHDGVLRCVELFAPGPACPAAT